MRGITWSEPTLPRHLLAIALLLGLVASLAGGPVMAQDDGVADEPAVTEAPPSPTDPPPPPTAIPTEPPPPPTAVPTEPLTPPTAVPTDIPAPTDVPVTEIPVATEIPTAVPAEEPSPTPTPELAYTLAAEAVCELAPGQAASITAGGSIEYSCVSTMVLEGTGVAPDTVSVSWTVRAEATGDWDVQLLPPTTHADSPVSWTPLRGGNATFTFEPVGPAGSTTEPGIIDREVTLRYQVRVLRPACDLQSNAIQLTHDATVTSPGAIVAERPVEQRALRLAPTLMPLPDPVVVAAVDEFDTSEWTGQAYSPVTATASLAVTAPCATSGWDIQLTITPFTGDELSVAVPLRIVQGTVLAGEANVAIGGIVTPGTPQQVASGSGTATLYLELELALPPTVPVGTFETTMNFTITTGP